MKSKRYYPHENASLMSSDGKIKPICDVEMEIAKSIDPGWDRWECPECGAGISFKKGHGGLSHA